MQKCLLLSDLNLLGKKWTFELLQEIALHKSVNFNRSLENLKGIRPTVLSRRLKELETSGVVTKKKSATEPAPRVFYHLTEKGLAVCELLNILKEIEKNCSKSFVCIGRCTLCSFWRKA
jgi:DNA-binding HxlR family transcriptional regulator